MTVAAPAREHDSGRKIRADAFPEDGKPRLACCGHPTPCGCDAVAFLMRRPEVCCVDCPLAECLFVIQPRVSPLAMENVRRTVALRASGASTKAIQRELGITRRTVFRRLAKAKEAVA